MSTFDMVGIAGEDRSHHPGQNGKPLAEKMDMNINVSRRHFPATRSPKASLAFSNSERPGDGSRF
jgi:hypothetical protein